MGKLKHRAAAPKPVADPAGAAQATPFEPLPPPRRNKALLVTAIGLLTAWIIFLVLLVLWY